MQFIECIDALPTINTTLCMLRLTHALVAPNRLYGAPADMNPDLPLLADSSRPMASLVIANLPGHLPHCNCYVRLGESLPFLFITLLMLLPCA